MSTYEHKPQASIAEQTTEGGARSGDGEAFQFVDNRPTSGAQRELNAMSASAPHAQHTAQLRALMHAHVPRGSQVIQQRARGGEPVLQLAADRYNPGLDADGRAKKQNQGPAGHQIDQRHMAHKSYHKINRIAGVLFPIDIMARVRAPLEAAIAEINASPVAAASIGAGAQKGAIRAASETVLDEVIANPDKTAQQADQCAMLGPLDYWSNLETPTPAITTKLKDLRFAMMQRARMSIIAHRAMGATNRTFGGLIPDDDPERARPTENSPAAFRTALTYAASADNLDGIDGVECDVFLSKDGVAMLSHDSNIHDQMSAARRAVFETEAVPADAPGGTTAHNAKIEHYTAAELGAMKRRVHVAGEAEDASAFMTLNGLLTAALPVATAYAAHTRKAFRVEIEMKGHNVGAHDVIDVTAKTVSKFKKANPTSHNLEIIMFNGDPAAVELHAAKRSTKSQLGGLIVGLGKPPGAVADDRIDEYRGSLATAAQVRDDQVSRHVSTYVLGAENSLLNGAVVTPLLWPDLPAAVNAIIGLNVSSAADEDAIYAANRDAINADLVAPDLASKRRSRKTKFQYAMRVELARQKRDTHLAAQHAIPTAPANRTHVLTDFPERAADTRARIAGGPVPPIAPPLVAPVVPAAVAPVGAVPGGAVPGAAAGLPVGGVGAVVGVPPP
ncbi:glycerophosphodiester phosphodiesterase [Pandoraea pneumonica]|uniref:glycerophosphodiester phosphodiesterase n=1 Tax=Pandoraea pneumonica TaxID=2508299 RepID=UPI003CF82E7D